MIMPDMSEDCPPPCPSRQRLPATVHWCRWRLAKSPRMPGLRGTTAKRKPQQLYSTYGKPRASTMRRRPRDHPATRSAHLRETRPTCRLGVPPPAVREARRRPRRHRIRSERPTSTADDGMPSITPHDATWQLAFFLLRVDNAPTSAPPPVGRIEAQSLRRKARRNASQTTPPPQHHDGRRRRSSVLPPPSADRSDTGWNLGRASGAHDGGSRVHRLRSAARLGGVLEHARDGRAAATTRPRMASPANTAKTEPAATAKASATAPLARAAMRMAVSASARARRQSARRMRTSPPAARAKRAPSACREHAARPRCAPRPTMSAKSRRATA